MKIEHWGLEEYPGLRGVTADIVAMLRDLWPDHSGPAHIVLADFNFGDAHIEWCIEQSEAGNYCDDYPQGHPVFKVTTLLLRELLAIPESERWSEGW